MMSQLLKTISYFSLILPCTIESHDRIAETPTAQPSFIQKTSRNLQNKAQVFKKNIPVALRTIGVSLKIALTAAPLIVFAHHAPRLTAGMNPLGAIAYTAGCALCAGIAGGLVCSGFDKK